MTTDKIAGLIEQMTLDEKIGMIHGNAFFHTKGVERLGVPPFIFSDGPMGVRKEYYDDKWYDDPHHADYASYLPSNTAIAATWNPELARKSGRVLGKEARGRGKDMILAPGINIMRSPLCGRNFEYMGEDPCLTANIAVPLIEGIQENDVSACVKHFAVNSQETQRLGINEEVDERTLREIYFPAFKAAVQKAKSRAIMGAYNQLNGQYCCQNEYLLKKVLRNDWKYEGLTVSDWGGVTETNAAAMNGMDVEMNINANFDEYYFANPLKEKILAGEIPESVVDEKVRNILNLMNEIHMLDGDRKPATYNDYRDKEDLLETARESVVLLKNDGVLPIKREKGKKILVVGDNANRAHAPGGGSGEIKALYELTPLMGISMLSGGSMKIVYEPGYESPNPGDIWDQERKESWQAASLAQAAGLEQEVDLNDVCEYMTPEQIEKNKELFAKAVEAAKDADLVIFVGGLNHDYDTEGKDRRNMILPYGQDELIGAIHEVNPNLVVVINAGSPVDMRSFRDKARAIVYEWYCGMEGGRALGEVLYGEVNPSGRLPETMPLKDEDVPPLHFGVYPGNRVAEHKEGIYVGYRYYVTHKVPTAFPFGFGLSYTDFEKKNLAVSTDEDGNTLVELEISNVGSEKGKDTVQIYVEPVNPCIDRPTRELKGFAKVELEAGETKKVALKLDAMAFAYYSVEKECFVAKAGDYRIVAAAHAEDDGICQMTKLVKDVCMDR